MQTVNNKVIIEAHVQYFTTLVTFSIDKPSTIYDVYQKLDPCDILKYFQQIWTNINFWYRESSMRLQFSIVL